MKREFRCSKCGHLLGVEKDGKLQILCVHRGSRTNGVKCGEINSIPLNIGCPSCKTVNKMV